MRSGRFLPGAVLGAALWLLGPAAPAQTEGGAPPPSLAETLTGEAKEDYQSGRRLYQSGDYAGALSKLQSAARASNDPRLLWDAAACERAMQHYARAIALVHRYLDSHSPLIAPDAERDARNFLHAAEGRTARLDVQGCALRCGRNSCGCDSSEPGAIVSLDGESLGVVPLAAETRIDFGTHTLLVKKEGFEEYATTFTVASSADLQMTAVLEPTAPAKGLLVVRAGSGDTIAVDGAPVGVGAWEGVLPRGPHSLRVTEPHSGPFESEVVVEPHQTRSLDVTLLPARRAEGMPAWLWMAGGTVLAAGAVTAGYFVFKPSEPQSVAPLRGSAGTVQLP